MNAEIIAVGSELLLGQIANTNAKFISSQLSELGVNVFYHTVVGDNANRLEEVIAIAESRADVIIFSGGLGPTKDDLTKETIARHLGVELVFDGEALQSIEDFYVLRGKAMTDNSRKQALILAGSEVLSNHHGMAPGMLLVKNNRTYILLPGPPKELEPMFQFQAKPKLAATLNSGGVIVSHVLRFYGIGEAELEHRIQQILDEQTNPTVAPLAADGEVTLRITAKAATEQQAWQMIEDKKAEILAVEGVALYLYGVDDDSLSSQTVAMLLKNGLTIAAAESLTAGLFQSELAEISGVSGTLVGGVVTYTEQAKIQQLGFTRTFLDEVGVVSEACAVAMAKSVRHKFATNIGVGLTGVAGPQTHDNKPVGTVWVALALSEDDVVTREMHLSGTRNTNRIRAVKLTCSLLMKELALRGYQKG